MNTSNWPQVRAYLLLSSENDLLQAVSVLLGYPDRVHERGDSIGVANPNRTRERNRYIYGQLQSEPCLDVPAVVDRLIAKIGAKGADLVALGIDTQLTIVTKYVGEQAPTLSFPPEVIATLHAARASIDIDTYPYRRPASTNRLNRYASEGKMK